jgi:hypothetical protein
VATAGASAQEIQRETRPGASRRGAISAKRYCVCACAHSSAGAALFACAAASREYSSSNSCGSHAPSRIQRAIMRSIIP